MGEVAYVCGFLFDKTHERVVLIHKTKGPESVIGKLNGVGGKVEENELPALAMRREFKEETGLDVPEWDWFLTYTLPNAVVYFYKAFVDEQTLDLARTAEDEKVGIYSAGEFLPSNVVPNLLFIIPMALHKDNPRGELIETA